MGRQFESSQSSILLLASHGVVFPFISLIYQLSLAISRFDFFCMFSNITANHQQIVSSQCSLQSRRKIRILALFEKKQNEQRSGRGNSYKIDQNYIKIVKGVVQRFSLDFLLKTISLCQFAPFVTWPAWDFQSTWKCSPVSCHVGTLDRVKITITLSTKMLHLIKVTWSRLRVFNARRMSPRSISTMI